MVTRNGEYVLQLIELYGVDLPTVVIALLEVITITYVYGLNRYTESILKKKTSDFFTFCYFKIIVRQGVMMDFASLKSIKK